MISQAGIRTRFIVLSASHAGGVLCGFFSTLIMVRTLGAEGYGYVAIAIAVLTYGLVLTNFGADLYAVQSTASKRSKLARNFTAVATVRAALSIPVFALIVFLVISGVWEPEAQLAVMLFSLSIFVNILYPLWAPQALERIDVVAICNFIVQGLNLIFVIAAAFTSAGIVGYALAKVGSDLIVAIGLFVWTRSHIGGRVRKISFRQLRLFLWNAAPIGASQLLRSIALGSDIIILSFYITGAMVGLYAVSFRIFTLLLSISSVYFVIVLPIFSRRSKQGSASLHKTLQNLLHLPLPLVIFGAIVIAVIARPVIGLLFGAEFAAGAPVLQILLIAVVANFINRSYRQVLLATGKRAEDLTATIAGTAVNLTAKLVLIPLIGFLGAAVGTALGEVTLAILQRRSALRSIHVSNKTARET